MGEVYLAEDTRLHRKVAIKLLLPKSASDEQARKRLIREARTAAQLDHPNICAIHEVADDASFIVMQYIEGETLAATIRTKRLELRESLDIVIQILTALSEAHAQGIIHRDIKPQNIIITPRGQVKVLDFGLAKTVYQKRPIESEAETESILTETGMVVGTVGYMSPEQAKGADLDVRSDLFSVGALLYECVTGRPAFNGNNLIDICAQVIHIDPPAPSRANPSAPLELDTIVLKALAKEADARYETAGEFLADLSQFRDRFEAVAPKPITLDARTSRVSVLNTIFTVVRNRHSLAATIVVLVIAVLSFLVSSRVWRRAAHQAPQEAKRWYYIGTNALRDGAYYQASNALERATSVDDKFALAHARLADAWTELDYRDRAKDELLRVSALVPDRSALPELDALYLKAITDTVNREFPAAVDSYRQIVQRVPESESAFAYVDLGRAYEKNEEIENAIASYVEAIHRDPLYASAFLRLGTLRGRKDGLDSGNEALKVAENLYRTQQRFEGLTEVLYQRGSLLNSIDKLSEARAQLLEALKITETTSNEHQRIATLLQLSGLFAAEGNMVQAQQYASDAINLAGTHGIENLAARGLIDLGNAFFLRGNYGEAEKY
jgi:tetratricopeptide (TPR) repeat protein